MNNIYYCILYRPENSLEADQLYLFRDFKSNDLCMNTINISLIKLKKEFKLSWIYLPLKDLKNYL